MTRSLSVLVEPRDGPPYQELLYRKVEDAGVRVSYLEGPSPSHTLNLLLAPALLMRRRFSGYTVLHIHWIHQYSLPWARRKQWARRLMEMWLSLNLRFASALGFAIVWTAHDLLPHERIFADDVRARDLLVSRARVVIALSDATAAALREIGAYHVRVIPMGSYAEPYPVTLTHEEARASFGFGDDDLVISLIGRLEHYKGADLLLRAIAQLPASSRIKLLIAGSCSDPAYRDELERLVRASGRDVVADFRWLPDRDLARYLQATDISVFPFREITNSGSIFLAHSFGLPTVIPDLPTLSDIPESAAIRFEASLDSLVGALRRAEQLSSTEYQEMSSAAFAWSNKADWVDVADATIEAYVEALGLQGRK